MRRFAYRYLGESFAVGGYLGILEPRIDPAPARVVGGEGDGRFTEFVEQIAQEERAVFD